MDIGEKDNHVYRLFIFIAAQNFTVDEYLDFKKTDNGEWYFKYAAYKTLPVRPNLTPKSQVQRPIKLEEIDWTHDLNSITRLP